MILNAQNFKSLPTLLKFFIELIQISNLFLIDALIYYKFLNELNLKKLIEL